MMDMITERRNRIRGLVLKFLAPEYPGTVDSVVLRRLLDDMGYTVDERSLTSYLAYLKERNYIRVEEKEKYGLVFVRISANGLNLVDGTIDPDPGIEVG